MEYEEIDPKLTFLYWPTMSAYIRPIQERGCGAFTMERGCGAFTMVWIGNNSIMFYWSLWFNLPSTVEQIETSIYQ